MKYSIGSSITISGCSCLLSFFSSLSFFSFLSSIVSSLPIWYSIHSFSVRTSTVSLGIPSRLNIFLRSVSFNGKSFMMSFVMNFSILLFFSSLQFMCWIASFMRLFCSSLNAYLRPFFAFSSSTGISSMSSSFTVFVSAIFFFSWFFNFLLCSFQMLHIFLRSIFLLYYLPSILL